MAKKNKNQLRVVGGSAATQSTPAQRITISPRWLLSAIGLTLLGAAVCAWATLCLLFWQGSWQLLYHPNSDVSRTPASVGLKFDSSAFAATETGQLRLQGWWIPAAADSSLNRYTVLYFHGQNGNLGDSVGTLAKAHAAGVNVFAFDYRGYGRSQFVRPSETNWKQDANWALDFLTGTRHIDPHQIVLMGSGLGANLALEMAAAHPELAGVVLEGPLPDPMSAIFSDPRARLVPAHVLVHDRYDLASAASAARIPSLWIVPPAAAGSVLRAYDKTRAAHQMVRDQDVTAALNSWLNSLTS